MFTGLITDIGTVIATQQFGDLRVKISTSYLASTIALGASVACDGVCLTVVDKGSDTKGVNWFAVDISAETIARTNIGRNKNGWQVGRRVNLERSLKVGDELGGHIVSGHVDGLAEVVNIGVEGDSTRVTFVAPNHLARFIAAKGSVALNGTSLTVNEVDGNRFGINLIPHTKTVTTWGAVAQGDKVNLEIDTLARYVARLAEMQD